jgi:hypothetical protein
MTPPNVMESGVFHEASWSSDTPLHLEVMTPLNVMESVVFHGDPWSSSSGDDTPQYVLWNQECSLELCYFSPSSGDTYSQCCG